MTGVMQGMGSSSEAVLGSQERIQEFSRTKLCKFNLLGICTRGASCMFAHGTNDLEEQPDYSKTRLCTDFTFGKCTNGDNCMFAHGKYDLKLRSDAMPKPTPKPTAMSKEVPKPAAMSKEVGLVNEALFMQLLMASKLQGNFVQEQAMMSLLRQSIASKMHAELRRDEQGFGQKRNSEPDTADMSFSHSTTFCEGEAETAESLLNVSNSVKPISAHGKEKAKPAEKRIIVKNTFLHIEKVKATMPRSHSMPQLQVP